MITVVVSTWDDGTGIRLDYAQKVIPSLSRHLKCSVESLHLHIADDGSEDGIKTYTPMLSGGGTSNSWVGASITSPVHNGIGSSLNTALRDIDDLWVYTTDDWLLTDDVNLDSAVKLLRQGYDYVRIGPVHPNLECITRFQQGIGWWIELCNTTGFAFATRPFIATKKFYEKVGPFLEGATSYVVEQDYAIRCIQKRHGLNLAAVCLDGPFVHIGDYEVGKNEVIRNS